jgi:hypothetical protein
MPKRDSRYDYIKPMLNDGKLHSFLEIFQHVPKSVVAKDLGKKLERFSELLDRIDQFKTGELFLIAHFCKLNEREMLDLFLAEYLKNKRMIEKSKPVTDLL